MTIILGLIAFIVAGLALYGLVDSVRGGPRRALARELAHRQLAMRQLERDVVRHEVFAMSTMAQAQEEIRRRLIQGR